MEVELDSWYIDAWAVHDGRVFASRRLPSSEPQYVQSAGSTVFMSVPDLQAVPVGRISTALRATRSGFQEGFRDAEATEIAFESLAQVRDLVRRAYLAAGLGPGSPGATAGPIPGPDVVDDGPGGRYLDDHEDRQLSPIFYDGWPPDATLDIAGFEIAVEDLAFASIIDWVWRLNLGFSDSPEVERAYIGWIAALARSGVFRDRELSVNPSFLFHRLAEIVDEPWMRHTAARLIEFAPPGLGALDLAAGTYWTRGHLAVVPLPRSHHWDRRLRRMIEMYLLPMVRRTFWNQPIFAADIAPLVLVEMVQSRPTYLGRLDRDVSPVVTALDNVRASAHFVDLPYAAEKALDGFVEACISGDTGSHEPPPAAVAHA
jgi:hypothetical protein